MTRRTDDPTRASLRAARFLPALLGLLALSGCLAEDGADGPAETRACLGFGPQDADASTPAAGGDGPREVAVTALDAAGQPVPHAAVAAWWNASGGPEGLLLRAGADGTATFRLPASIPLNLLGASSPAAANGTWDLRGRVQEGDGPASIQLVGDLVAGQESGEWTEPVAIGVQERSWQPSDLAWADASSLGFLQELVLTLEWTNAPEGGADFGIAVGEEGLDHYWNQEYQTGLGPYGETLTLDRGELEGFGWAEADALRAGPSISTGGFSATGIPYTIAWEASFADPPLPCGPSAG